MDDRLAAYASRIREVYPDLAVTTIRRVEHGQNNDVVIVNEGFVFRFPRYHAGIDRLEAETRLLRGIQRYVTLAVPNPIYASFSPREVGRAFMGYRLLPGRPLRREDVDRFREDALRALAAQLAAFLKGLHGVPPDAVLPGDRAAILFLARWEDLYERIRRRLFPFMRAEARARIVAHFETFLRDPHNRTISPVLTHGDFGGGNILFDAATHTATGMIDFGSAGLDDPAVDFAAMSTIAPRFLEYCIPAYPQIQSALNRVAFYRGTFALQEAVFGVENGDEEAFRAGIAPYT